MRYGGNLDETFREAVKYYFADFVRKDNQMQDKLAEEGGAEKCYT